MVNYSFYFEFCVFCEDPDDKNETKLNQRISSCLEEVLLQIRRIFRGGKLGGFFMNILQGFQWPLSVA